MHNLFFFFRNLKISILTQPVKEYDGVQDLPADDAMPAEEDIINIVKLFENHSSAAPLTAHTVFLFIPSSHDGYLIPPSVNYKLKMQFFCQRFPFSKKKFLLKILRNFAPGNL
jgi:hypothetical protein